jgi:dedicator of cytokinesis protein 3
MTTEEQFPTVLRRSEIIDFQHVEISPIESALISVQQQTKELTSLDLKFTTLAKIDAVPSTNALTMALNEIVDFPSDMGLALYRQTFLTADYLSRHPDEELYIRKLRDAIDELVQLHVLCSLLGVPDPGDVHRLELWSDA